MQSILIVFLKNLILIIIKLLYNLLTPLSVNQEEKEVKWLERSRVFKAKEVKGLYNLTYCCIITKDFLELLYNIAKKKVVALVYGILNSWTYS